ncbi:hypothetical protein P0240_16615 [Enterobacter cloacae]|uniref:hypothetical protein n=1 Tax=Enterobacter cloacae complex TaxID=354276 RepID=UPI00065022AD|nr:MULTISPECIES: hypothetical protein [Enterobacter cloacae complex]HDT3786036.1 hypothetical protein [Enterobacter hormaechei subsp. steigerwaltii]KLW09135.1 hypothetical protein SK45_00423 [Enterobacter hormaechei]KLW11090.1 hypothetical protein SK46_02893 [Enterobacter hormaechei]MCM7399115.1 hypothetical protein [Enterobacter cloacae]QGN44398.1 hypothetical protein GJ694_20280 [Enterobacter cloacae]
MHKSDLPADYEIRVLVTVKNGQVTERRLRPNEIVATQEGFIQAIRQAADVYGLTATDKE